MAQADDGSQLVPEKISLLPIEEIQAHLRARGLNAEGKKYPLVKLLREALLKEENEKASGVPSAASQVAAPPAANTTPALTTQTATGSWQKDLAPGAVPKSAQLQPRPAMPPNPSPRPRAWTPYPSAPSSEPSAPNSGSGSHAQQHPPSTVPRDAAMSWPSQWPAEAAAVSSRYMEPPRRPAMPMPQQQAPPQRPPAMPRIPQHMQHTTGASGEWYPPEPAGDMVNGDTCDRPLISDDRAPRAPKQSDADVAARFAALLARPGKKALPAKKDGGESTDLRSRVDRLVTKQAERVRSRSRVRKSKKDASKPQSKSKPTKPLMENAQEATNSVERGAASASPPKDYIDTFLDELGHEDASESDGAESLSRAAQLTRQSASSASRRRPVRDEADKLAHPDELLVDGRRGIDGHHANEDPKIDSVGALRRRRMRVKAVRITDRGAPEPLEQDGLVQPLELPLGADVIEASDRICPVSLRRCIHGWWARLQEGADASRGSVDLKRASFEVRELAKHRDIQSHDRRKELRREASLSWDLAQESHSREIKDLERDMTGEIRGDHQWLEYAVDMQKQGVIEALESFIAAVSGQSVQLHEAYTTLEELHARAQQARSGLRDSILTQLELDELGGDSVSTERRREIHDIRLSMLKARHVEERRLLEDAERDLDRYDPQILRIESDFLEKVHSHGGAILPPARAVNGHSEKAAVAKALRHAAASTGVNLEEVVSSLESAEQDNSLTLELMQVLKKARRLWEVLRDAPVNSLEVSDSAREHEADGNGEFSSNGQASWEAETLASPRASPSRSRQQDVPPKAEERPALARRTKLAGAPGVARSSSPTSVVLTRRPLQRRVGQARRGYDDEAPGRPPPPPREEPRAGRSVDRTPAALPRREDRSRSRSRRQVFKPALRVVAATGHTRSGSPPPRPRHRHPQLVEHNSGSSRPRSFRPRERDDSPGYRGGYGQQRSR